MPKVQRSTNSYVSEFKDTFTSDGRVLFCVLYEKKVGSDKRFNVVQHLKTDKHYRIVERVLSTKIYVKLWFNQIFHSIN